MTLRTPAGADDDDLSGLDVAHELGADDVERAGLRGQDPGLAEPAEHQRPHAERVAHPDDLVLRQRHQRIGALDLPQRIGQPIDDGVLEARRDQMDDDLGVAGRLEQAAAAHQLPAQLIGVGQVAVVADGEPAELEIGEQRLHVAQRDLAGRRIADMADRGTAAQAPDHLLGAEIVADKAQSAMRVELLAVIGDDPGSLLAAMLQRVQTERRQRRGVGVAIDPEYAAFFVEMIASRSEGIGRGIRDPRLGTRYIIPSQMKYESGWSCNTCYRVFSISRSMSRRSPGL